MNTTPAAFRYILDYLSLSNPSSLRPPPIVPRSQVTKALVARRRERSRAGHFFRKRSRSLLLLADLLLLLFDSPFDCDSPTRSYESIMASTDQ